MVRARDLSILLLNDNGELQMDQQLKSRFEQVLQQHYVDVIKEREDALLREKKAESSLKHPSALPWTKSSFLLPPR
jgi:hypothetical protein